MRVMVILTTIMAAMPGAEGGGTVSLVELQRREALATAGRARLKEKEELRDTMNQDKTEMWSRAKSFICDQDITGTGKSGALAVVCC